MKEKVIIIATILIVVISFPFLAVKSEKTAKVREEELRESRKQEQYQKAVSCMENDEYEQAIAVY